MSKLKVAFWGIGTAGMIAAFAFLPTIAKADVLSGKNTDIGNLIVLDELFNGNGNLLGDHLFNGDNTRLGDLIILDRLFGNTHFFGNNDDLSRLYLYSQLFNSNTNDSSGSSNSSGMSK